MTESGSGVRAALRNLGWMLGSRGVQAVLSLVYLGIATRSLGITEFGRFVLITGASQAIVTFIAFPTWRVVIHFGVPHLASANEAAFGRLLRACAILDAASAIVGMIISIAIVQLLAQALGIPPALKGHVLIFSLIQLLTLRSTPLGILRLRDRYSDAAWADSATPVIRCIGAVIAFVVAPTVSGFLASWAVAEVATAAAFWWYAGRTGDLARMQVARVTRRAVLDENPGFTRFVMSGNASATLSLANKKIPLLLVGGLVGPAAAGAFRLAMQLSGAFSKLGGIMSRAAFPELVRAVRSPGGLGLEQMLGRIVLASAAVALPVFGLVWLAGEPLLALVAGKSFAGAYPLLRWLTVAACIDLATVAFEPMLLAMNRAHAALVCNGASTVLQLIALFVLTPLFDVTGATMAMVAGSLASAVLLGIACWRAARHANAKGVMASVEQT